MRRCQNCNLPEGKFKAVLNDKGICNYCEYFEQNKQDILNIPSREQILARRFQKLKGKYEYDAVVGLSGGKDSTYVIYQMVKKYNIKVAAVTFDNGFLTNFARESIKNTVENLGVDHYYYKPNWNTHKKFYKAAVQKLGDPCIACAIGGYFLAIKACYENKIPFFIHGRTPFQMYRNFYKNSNDVFLTLMKLNLMEHSFTVMSNVYSMINEYVKQAISRIADSTQEAKEITDEFFVDSSKLTEEFVPEFLAYFLFEEYDEEKIKKVLEDVLNWGRPASDNLLGHHDCAIHAAAGYMYKELNDVNILEPDVAAMVRFEAISKEKADELIKLNEPTVRDTEKSLDSLCALCEFNREDLAKTLVALKQAGVSSLSLVSKLADL
jgi:hypothetical protein